MRRTTAASAGSADATGWVTPAVLVFTAMVAITVVQRVAFGVRVLRA